MSNNQVQIRRGTAAENDAFTGVQGEVTYETDTFRLRTHDGALLGGYKMSLLKGDTFTGLIQFSGTAHAGLQLNSLTTVQRDAIGAPVNGMLIYNSTTNRVNPYVNGAWITGWTRLDGDTMTGPLIMGGATTNSGLQLKNLSTVSRNALTPLAGMIIWNVNTNHVEAVNQALAWEAYAKQAGDTFTGLVQFSGTTHAGVRLNNLTNLQMVSIAAPTAGMIVFDTDNAIPGFYNGTDWIPVAGSFASPNDPEGNLSGSIGCLAINTTTNSLWYKKTGTGNTGWVALLA